MGKLFRMRSTFDRPSDATQYAAGDEVSSHATAGSVVRATFDLSGFTRGRIFAAEIDVTTGDASNVVTTAADLELLLFRTPDAPTAVGDNVTHPIAAAVRALAVARFRFDDTAYTGPLGTVAAGTSQSQAVMPTAVYPLAANVLEYPIPFFVFSFEGQKATQRDLTVVMRALAAWNPGAKVNTIGITLDIEAE